MKAQLLRELCHGWNPLTALTHTVNIQLTYINNEETMNPTMNNMHLWHFATIIIYWQHIVETSWNIVKNITWQDETIRGGKGRCEPIAPPKSSKSAKIVNQKVSQETDCFSTSFRRTHKKEYAHIYFHYLSLRGKVSMSSHVTLHQPWVLVCC